MKPKDTLSPLTLDLSGGAANGARRVVKQWEHFDDKIVKQAQLAIQKLEHEIGEPARRALEQWRQFDSQMLEEARQAVERFERQLGEPAPRALEQLHQFDRAVFDSLRLALKDIQRDTHWESLLNFRQIGAEHLQPYFGLAPGIIGEAQAMRDVSIKAILEETTNAGVWAIDPAFGARLTSIPAAYSSFCQATIKDLSLANKASEISGMLGSIKLAEIHLQDVTSVLPAIIEAPQVANAPIPTTPARLYVVQRAELAEAEINDPQNVSELVQKSPAANAAGRVLQMLKLIPQINSTARLCGRTDILKHTNRVYDSSLDLVGLVPTNQSAFADFIDRLYWIFYEGAGEAKLRYLDEHGGPFAKSDCEVVWAIKTFRNKWCRHDVEHGDPSKINESYRVLKETLKRFGFERFPDSAKDYRRIHLMLVNELIQFLQKLRDRLG